MPVSVQNTISVPDKKKAIANAVLEGIGDRRAEEQWSVRIIEPPDRPDYIVTIEGPRFKWKRDFFGPHEQTPEFIRSAVKEATRRSAPVDYDPIIERLLEKSEEGRVPWEKGRYDGWFVCILEVGPGRVYTFQIEKAEDTFTLRMKDADGNEIFSVSAQEEVVFGPWEKQLLFNRLRDIFELARRKGLSVDQKLSEVASLLDAI